MTATTSASQFKQGKIRVDSALVFVPFGTRCKSAYPFVRTGEYITKEQARLVGCKNMRPDDAGLHLVADWPKHLQ